MRLLGIVVAAVPALAGCVAYNDQCQPLVPNPEAVDGYLATNIFIDKPNARHANNGLGQLAAEAYVWGFRAAQSSSPASYADLSVINGGGIRTEGTCVTRNILARGPLRSGVLHDTLPFDNQVIALDVLPTELVALFENGAAGLSRAGAQITSPPPQFLHPSGATLTIDCGRDAGIRVIAMQVNGVDVVRADGGGALGADAGTFRLAITDFLLYSGQGTSDILKMAATDPARRPLHASTAGGVDSDIVEQYMRATYGADHPFVPDGGIKFVNCAVPPPPAQ